MEPYNSDSSQRKALRTKRQAAPVWKQVRAPWVKLESWPVEWSSLSSLPRFMLAELKAVHQKNR